MTTMLFKSLALVAGGFLVTGCQPTPPEVDYSSANVIAIRYEAYGTTPTLTPQTIDMAVEHCRAQGNKFANYRGVSVPNILSAEEVHTFVCEATKTDDNAVIAAQNEQYMNAAIAASTPLFAPTSTTCTTIGFTTNCNSY
jgi:hypothetical protein